MLALSEEYTHDEWGAVATLEGGGSTPAWMQRSTCPSCRVKDAIFKMICASKLMVRKGDITKTPKNQFN